MKFVNMFFFITVFAEYFMSFFIIFAQTMLQPLRVFQQNRCERMYQQGKRLVECM